MCRQNKPIESLQQIHQKISTQANFSKRSNQHRKPMAHETLCKITLKLSEEGKITIILKTIFQLPGKSDALFEMFHCCAKV